MEESQEALKQEMEEEVPQREEKNEEKEKEEKKEEEKKEEKEEEEKTEEKEKEEEDKKKKKKKSKEGRGGDPTAKRRKAGTPQRLKTPLAVLDSYLPSCPVMAAKLSERSAIFDSLGILEKSLIERFLDPIIPDTTVQCRGLTELYLAHFDLEVDVFHMKKIILEDISSTKIPKHIKTAFRGVRNKATVVEASLLPEIRKLFVRTLMSNAIKFMAEALCFYEKTHGIRLSKTDGSVLESALTRPHRVSYWAIKKVYDNNVAQWEQKHQQYVLSLKTDGSTTIPDRDPITRKSKKLQKQIFNVFIEGSWLQRYDELRSLGAQDAMRRLSTEWASNKDVQSKWAEITKVYNQQLTQDQVTPESKETHKKLLTTILQNSTSVSST